ncbi:tyrosine-protein kinase Shark [Octopus vulgaris]|uniref:Tyrosine-protein kinase Shark n=1 Tax=Octopus vulgaris TaxID=6645 RepID=A0AA36BTE8_OCTVU|nr:tyrosine-protein kinase Shark [Octopus vulgaris]
MGDVGSLRRAVRSCDLPLVRRLVKGGVSVDQRLWYGTTLLQEAVTQAHVEMARVLIQYGKADLDAQNDDGKTALHIASRAGQEALVDLLIEAGAKVNIQCLDETTSLHLAMWKSKANVVEKLIGAGANPNLRDQDEWTPLHWGAKNGNFELVRLLVNNGAKTNVVSKALMTPLTLSVVKRHLSITKYLLMMGAGLDIIENSEKKPVSFSSLLLEPNLLKDHNTEVLQLVDIMMENGCDLWLERKTLLSKQPAANSLAEQLHRILVSHLSTPPTLQEICRFFLRQHLHHHYQKPPKQIKKERLHCQHKLYIDKVIALEVPKHLEDFILTRSERIQIACRAKKPPKTPPPMLPPPSDSVKTKTNKPSKPQNNSVKPKSGNIINLKKNGATFSSGKEMAKLEETHKSQGKSAKWKNSKWNSYPNQNMVPPHVVRNPNCRTPLLNDPVPRNPVSQPLLSKPMYHGTRQNKFSNRNPAMAMRDMPDQAFTPVPQQRVRRLIRFSDDSILECHLPEPNATHKKRSWRSNKQF